MTIFPRHPTLPTFSMMIHYVFLFHAAALCLPFPFCSCAMSTFFHAAALCLLFPRCSTKTTFMRWFMNFRGGGGGAGPIRQKKLWQRSFFTLVLSLFSREGVQLLIPHRTPYNLWFSRGSGTPCPPPLWIRAWLFHFSHAAVACQLFHAAPAPPPPPPPLMTILRSAHTCTILQFYI